MSYSRFKTVIVLAVLLIIIGCTRADKPDSRLEHAAALADDSPREALAILESVCPDSLSDPDRHLYDFLTVKARDKAYITHTSDSLILGVIAYTEKHRVDASHRAEALYYGGRVYSDLGDNSTSLSYFQKALDALSDDRENLPLRGRILSQTGRLLSNLYLHDAAISYIEKAIEIQKIIGNHIGEINDLQLLGYNYSMDNRLDLAEKIYRSALKDVHDVPKIYTVDLWAGLADVKYRLGQFDSAYFYIKQIPDSFIHPASKTYIIASRALIYHSIGLRDSAYIFSKELLSQYDDRHNNIAYNVLLSEDMLSLSKPDSIKKLISDFAHYTNQRYKAKNSDMIMNHQNYYNYKKLELKLSEVEREKAKKEQYILWFSIAFILTLTAFIYVLIRHRFLLKKNTNVINDMKSEVSNLSQEFNRRAKNSASKEIEKSAQELRENLLQKVSSDVLPEKALSNNILTSDCYAAITENLREGTSIENNRELWKEIENIVLSDDPEFKNKLISLAGSRIGNNEWEVVLLIRLGFGTNEMATLLAKTKGAIDNRRYKLGQQMFGQKLPSPVITSAIEQI